jgi:hypothetical protein
MTCEPYTAGAEGDFELSDGWRCLNCGEMVDAVILGHREHVPEGWARRGRYTAAGGR